MAELGRIPAVGDVVTVPGWQIAVLAMDGMRADRLRFVPVPEPVPAPEAEDGSDAGGEPGSSTGSGARDQASGAGR
jgi:hypothetical protein